MKTNSLTLDEVAAFVNLFGGVEVVRMILQRTSTEVSDQSEEASQIPAAKRNPKPISVVLEICGISVNAEAPGFIVRNALQKLQESLATGQQEVFLPKSFFVEKFESIRDGLKKPKWPNSIWSTSKLHRR